jgi:AcrR family transcriptional regulator
MGSRERREREREDTRERIVDAAREMFAERGIDAVTMRAIADRIEYTPTAIYHHFRDKDALIRELCERDYRALAHHFQTIGRIEDPVERLRRLGMAYAEFGLTHPNHYRFMFMTPKGPRHPELGPDEGNPAEDAYAMLLHTVTEGHAAGRFRPDLTTPDQVAQIAWAAVHGVVSLHIAKGEDPYVQWCDPRETVRLTIDALIPGLVRGA